MMKHVQNTISVIGNDAVKKTHLEVIRRLRYQSDLRSDTAIGEVLYGLAPENANLGSDKITADWVRYSRAYGDIDDLTIDSGETTPDQLLNHIVWFYSKIDPYCILHHLYEHAENNFVGGSYRLVRKHKIRIFDKFRHNYKLVCSEDELTDKNFEEDEKITWEEFFDLRTEADLEARLLMLDEFSELKHHFVKRR